MLLAIGIDGADSPSGGCTTHLASLLLIEAFKAGLKPADYPWLIRLNPSIPYKTRGNGAIVLWFRVESKQDAFSFTRKAILATRDYASATGSARKAGVVALLYSSEDVPPVNDPPLRRLYHITLHGLTTQRVALEYLEESRGEILEVEDGGGVIGAAAAIGASLDIDYTFELLFYLHPDMWSRRPDLPRDLVKQIDFDLRPYGIANYDYVNDRPLVQPHGPDPVLAGVRADEPHPLKLVLRRISRRLFTHAVLYRSNQHTGVHIRESVVDRVKPYDCVRVCGRIYNVKVQPGGHKIAEICDATGCIHIAFYRELGRLTRVAEHLESRGACIEGCARPHSAGLTVNVERVLLTNDAPRVYSRIPPACAFCGKRLKRIAENVYKCKHCGLEVRGISIPVERDTHPLTILEPDPSAWHHLYMPYARVLRVLRPREITLPANWSDILVIS